MKTKNPNNMKKANEMNVVERLNAPTPKFFKKVQTAGIVAGSIGAMILTLPVALPVALVNVAGYLIACGGILAGTSQLAVDEPKK
jgi:uncharacterized membrane protein HdeD (DUF308 family)